MRKDRDSYKSCLFFLRQPPVSLKDQAFMLIAAYLTQSLSAHTCTHNTLMMRALICLEKWEKEKVKMCDHPPPQQKKSIDGT